MNMTNQGALTGGYGNNQQVGQQQNQISTMLAQKESFFINFYGQTGYKRAMETALAIANEPKFSKCQPLSIIEAIMASARVGLSVELGEAWLVPYKESVQFQIGSKGFTKLLYNSTAKWLVDAEPIYKCDNFKYQITGNGKEINFEPSLFKRENDNPAWVYENLDAIYVSGVDIDGRKIQKVVTKKQIEKLRLNSPGQVFKNQWTKPYVANRIDKKLPVDIWEKWYEEMAITKAIKLFAKRLPLGDAVVEKAIRLDDYAEVGKEAEFIAESSTLEAQTTTSPQNNKLNDLKLQAISLGFNVSGPVSKSGKFWIQAIPTGEESDTVALSKLGFLFLQKKKIWVTEVTQFVK